MADSVAQLVEQYTFNVWVLGSNPSRVTSEKFRNHTDFFCLRGEIGRHAILRGWFPKDVLVRVQSQAPSENKKNSSLFFLLKKNILIINVSCY